jgi:cbb3-type cytochrome oxidase subunit 3
MKKCNYFLLLLPLLFLTGCDSQSGKQNKENLTPVKIESAYNVDMYFAKRSWTEKADTLFLRFRIADKNNKKVNWANLKKENFEIREDGGNPPNKEIIIERIACSAGEPVEKADNISHNSVCWFLVDRSKTIADADLENMKEAILRTIENLPDSSAYISFFDSRTTEKKMITVNNFHEFENEFKVSKESKILYQSIYHSFMMFVNDAQKKDAVKYLLIFTDGKIDENSFTEVMELMKYGDLIKEIDNNIENNVQMHAFRYGNFPLADQALISICQLHRQKPELKGGFYPARNVAGIVDSLSGFMDNLSADYELVIVNHIGKIYNGTNLSLQVIINYDERQAVGKIQYAIGSKEVNIITGKASEDTYLAVLLGVIILFLAFFIMQVLIPYIKHKRTNFEKRYVKPYELNDDDVVYEACSFCQEPLEVGDLIVTKCPHKIHWDCWKDNGYKCVEYGQNCKDGVQYHFDKKHPFDLKKSPYYLKWAMSGMIGGFFIWIFFLLSSKLMLFESLIRGLLKAFYPIKSKVMIEGVLQIPNAHQNTFHSKIAGLLLAGILLGFVLTFLFSYINDFRQRTSKILFQYFIRSVVGASFGFLAFLIGSMVCIMLGKDYNVWWLDAIPWVLFGGSVALCLVYKTTIKWQDALMGGTISGIISFFILYTTSYLPAFGVMFSFMLCSGGLGISIIARHHLAQKYFLKYKCDKREGEIAIHKWMNDSGGSNEVSIGRSYHCVIQMNWDTSDNIPDKQVKLYLDPKRRIPMMKVLENGMTYDKRDTRKDDQLPLKNGVKFKIGNTEFQYVER